MGNSISAWFRPQYDLARIRQEMIKRFWSAEDLAREARVSPETIRNFLKGETQAFPETVGKIVKALGLSPDDVILPLLASPVPPERVSE